MSLFAMLKRNAKNALSNYWGQAIGVMLIPLLAITLLSSFIGIISYSMFSSSLQTAFYLPNPYDINSFGVFLSSNMNMLLLTGIVAIIYSAIILFIICPLILGSIYWYVQLVKGTPQPVGSVFYFFEKFSRYRRAVWFNISLGVRVFLWKILFFAVPCLMMMGNRYLILRFGNPFDSGTVAHFRLLLFTASFILTLLYILVVILFAAYTSKYGLAAHLICEDESLTTGKAIKKSIDYTKGYRFSLLWFKLSFIGWFILTVIIFPVALFTVPYFCASVAMYALYIIETKQREHPVVVDKPQNIKEPTTAEIVESPKAALKEESSLETPEQSEIWGASATSFREENKDLLDSDSESGVALEDKDEEI